MTKKIITFCYIFLTSFCFSQAISLSNKSKISILTCGVGPESYTMYGHTAIRIQDEISGFDVVYNYGAFDFSTQNFILKFVKGDLQYFVTNSSFIDFYYNYKEENREIIEQELHLSTNQINQIFQQLNAAVYSENKYYTYKFIHQNCTTMVVDKLNETLGNQSIKSQTKNITYREVLYPYMTNFYMKLGIQLIFGSKVDQPANAVFLPYHFKNSIANTNYNGKKLEKSTTILLASTPNATVFNFLNSIYSLLLILVLLAIFSTTNIRIIYFIISGLLGVFFFLVGFYSWHEEITSNYNMLLFNPLLLFLAYFMYKKNNAKIKLWSKINLFLLIVYLFFMFDKIHLQIIWPFILLHSYWFLLFLKSKKNSIQN